MKQTVYDCIIASNAGEQLSLHLYCHLTKGSISKYDREKPKERDHLILEYISTTMKFQFHCTVEFEVPVLGCTKC